MKAQENDQQQHPHVQESDHDEQLPEEEEQQQQSYLRELEKQPSHPISIQAPFTTHSSSSSPPPKPPPKLPSSRFDSPPASTSSSDHSFVSHGYVFSPSQLNPSRFKSPPEDQISHSYVFSSSPDVKPAKPSSPSLPEAAAPVSVSKDGSENQDDEVVKSVQDGVSGGGASSRRRASFAISGRKKEIMKRKTLLGCRFFGLVFCLASFSIMAADKNQGWALDSFYSYKEFRYCMSVNVMGFVYSGLQAYDLVNSLATGKLVAQNKLRYYLDFSLDQMLTYLLLSSSSSATFRFEEWESNWGKDKFPAMARSSVVLSYLAFIAFAFCSLATGHTVFTPKST